MKLNRLDRHKAWLGTLFLLLLAACAGSGATAVSPNNTATTASSSPTAAAAVAETVDPPAPPPERISADKYADYEIITLLPRDAIPAIDNPQFLSAADANEFYDPDELIIGVEFNGDARAYSVPFLSNHEIVNDTVGGVKIAVTW
jgi:ABC-type Fe3+-hydroxamate transport system substrate-binding protein